MSVRLLVASLFGLAGTFVAANASALPTKLDAVWAGNGGAVTVFIHGHGNCSNPGGSGYDGRCGGDAKGYWLNSTDDGGDGHDMMDDGTRKCLAMPANSNESACTSWRFGEAISLRYDGVNQGFWGATNDVAACLTDLVNGTNNSGCNAGGIKRTSFRVIAHSEGGTILDRIQSTGWWPGITSAMGTLISSSGALAGAKSASALYGTDGTGNFCTTLVSWLAGWALKDTGNASLTRGTVLGEANNGKAGKSPRTINKITTTGGGGSCNNNSSNGISESVNDSKMGMLCGCIGYSSDDDADGVLWMYDSDPTSNPAGFGGGKYQSAFTGRYSHWISSWANHSHTRNDAYNKKYWALGSSSSGVISVDTNQPGWCAGQLGNL